MNSKYFATKEAPEEGLRHLFPVNHTAQTMADRSPMSQREIWSPKGRLTSWGEIKPDTSHEAMMGRYLEFGEECAARNLVPTYRLFEHWMDSDAIAQASRSAKQPSVASRN